jgi:hypothetical protein
LPSFVNSETYKAPDENPNETPEELVIIIATSMWGSDELGETHQKTDERPDTTLD